jgi:hypothetical protein
LLLSPQQYVVPRAVTPHVWLRPALIPVKRTITSTLAVPAALSALAVMVTDPRAAAVTRPDELTVATLLLDEDQVNVLPGIGFPFASCALAESCNASPTYSSVALAGVTTTEATLGGGSVVSPQAASTSPTACQAAPHRARGQKLSVKGAERKPRSLGIDQLRYLLNRRGVTVRV